MEMDTAANCGEDDDWQLVNDDGFVYKCQKKRPCLDPSSSSSSSVPPPPPTPLDQELQRKNRMERKKIALLKKVRGSYQREILQWEQLSNTLSSMQQKTYILPEFHGDTASSGQPSSISLPSDQLSDPIGRQFMDELLLQAEAHETIIEDAVNVCEIAEAIFRKKERQFKLQFAALPVWESSPRALIMSLCDD